jgi:hypothetical protein
MIQGTLNAWANSLGKDSDTLRRALARRKLKLPAPGAPVSARVIFDALANATDDPKQRLLTAQAVAAEFANRETAGELVRMSEVEKLLVAEVVLPLRTRLLDLPSTLSVRCNPSNSETARVALLQWTDETLAMLRSHLGTAPTPTTEPPK